MYEVVQKSDGSAFFIAFAKFAKAMKKERRTTVVLTVLCGN